MSLTEARLTEAAGMRGLEAGGNRVLEDYVAGGAAAIPVVQTDFTGTNGAKLTTLANTGSYGGTAFVYQAPESTAAAPDATMEIAGNRGLLRTNPTAEFAELSAFTPSLPLDVTIYYSLVIEDVSAGGYIVVNTRYGGDYVSAEFWIHSDMLAIADSGNVGHGLTFADGDKLHVLWRSNGTTHTITLWLNDDPVPSSPSATGHGGAGVAGQTVLIFKRGPGGQGTFYLDDFAVYDDPTVAWPPVPEFAPSSLPGIDWWIDGLDTSKMTLAGSDITAVASQVGDKVFTAPTSPVYRSTDYRGTGIGGIDFDGSGRVLSWVGTPTITGPEQTVFFVVRNELDTVQRVLSMTVDSSVHDWNNTSGMALNSESGVWPSGYRGGGKLSTPTESFVEQWSGGVRVFNGSTETLYLLKPDGTTETVGPVTQTGNFNVGAIAMNAWTNNLTEYNGFMGVNAIGACDVALESGDITKLLDWMHDRIIVDVPGGGVYSDDFNRADGALGSPWVTVDTAPLAVVSNKLAATGTGLSPSYYNSPTAGDQWSEITTTMLATNCCIAPAVRIADANNYYYGYYHGEEMTIDLWKVAGGTFAQIGSTVSFTGFTHTMRVEAEGTTIRMYLDGTKIVEETDTSLATGKAGILTNIFASAPWPTADDWRGGDMPYVPLEVPEPGVYSDDFNRADTTSATGGLGPAWNDAEFYISSNKVKKNAGDHWVKYATDLGTPDHWIEVDVTGAIGGNNYIVPCVRCLTTGLSSGDAYGLFLQPDGDGIEVGRNFPGGYTTVATASLTHSGAGRLRLEVEGTALRCYFNDTLLISTTDTVVTAGNYVGITWRDDTGGVSTVDNFRCGALPYVSLYTDDFAYADGLLHTVSAGKWLDLGSPTVAGGKVVTLVDSIEHTSMWATDIGVNQLVEADITVNGSGGHGDASICTRMTPSDGSCYFAVLTSDSGGTIDIWRRTGNSGFVQLGVVTGVGYSGRVKLTSIGSQHTAYLNGVQQVQVTDTTWATQTKVGVSTYSTGGSATLDNFTAATLSVLYSDDFNRANGAVGAPWVDIEAATQTIDGNKVASGDFAISYYDQPISADQWVELDMTGIFSSGGNVVPCLRMDSATGNFYYLWNEYAAPWRLVITKRVGGSYSNLAGFGPTLTGSGKVRLEVEGTTLRAYLNGVLALTTTDTSIASGKPGLLSGGIGATGDNWRAGDLPYVPI